MQCRTKNNNTYITTFLPIKSKTGTFQANSKRLSLLIRPPWMGCVDEQKLVNGVLSRSRDAVLARNARMTGLTLS